MSVLIAPLFDVDDIPRRINTYREDERQSPQYLLSEKLTAVAVEDDLLPVNDPALGKPRIAVSLGDAAHKAERDHGERQAQKAHDVDAQKPEHRAREFGLRLFPVHGIARDMGMRDLPALQIERHSQEKIDAESDQAQKQPKQKFSVKLSGMTVEFELSAVHIDAVGLPTHIGAHQNGIKQPERGERKEHHEKAQKQVRQRAALKFRRIARRRFGRHSRHGSRRRGRCRRRNGRGRHNGNRCRHRRRSNNGSRRRGRNHGSHGRRSHDRRGRHHGSNGCSRSRKARSAHAAKERVGRIFRAAGGANALRGRDKPLAAFAAKQRIALQLRSAMGTDHLFFRH